MSQYKGLTEENFRKLFPDKFWRDFLSYIIEKDLEEDLYWDFKGKCFFLKTQNQQVHLKKQIGDINKTQNYEILKHISAFSNADSGVLIFGISNKRPRRPLGIQDCERCLTKIYDLIEKYLTPRLKIFYKIVEFQHKGEVYPILFVLIPKAPDIIGIKEYKHKYGLSYCLREGPSSRIIKNSFKLQVLMKEKEVLTIESYPVLSVIMNKIGYTNTEHTFREFLQFFQTYDRTQTMLHHELEEILEITSLWYQIDLQKKDRKISEFNNLNSKMMTFTIIVTIVPILALAFIFLFPWLDFLSLLPSPIGSYITVSLPFIIVTMAVFFLFYFNANLASKYVLRNTFNHRDLSLDKIDPKTFFPELLFYNSDYIHELIGNRKHQTILSKIHSAIATMRFNMSPMNIKLQKNSDKKSKGWFTHTFEIDPYFDPFFPRSKFEDWLQNKVKDVTLESRISSDIIDFSRVFNLYLRSSSFGMNLTQLAKMLQSSEEELEALINNDPELKMRALRYDRYYYIYRLEKTLRDNDG